MSGNSLLRRLRHVLIGRSRELTEHGLFHKLSLVALLAWVGLGADGLSSSCYGPEEAYKVLLAHPALAVFVALMAAATVTVICASYAQIIGLFPAGGGGYVVASRLLSPTFGVVSGAALLVDYVLTIAISAASAMDALFSFLPPEWLAWKLGVGAAGILFLIVLNLRGVRESVLFCLPVFILFLATHAFGIVWILATRSGAVLAVPEEAWRAAHGVSAELGFFGMCALLLRAYSMGAGTYTGIEAVSNGLSILREPRVRTGRRTMLLMALSLGGMAAGLLVAYPVMGVQPVPGKTLNAVLLGQMTAHWPGWLGHGYVIVAMSSAAALLLIAAQAGFLGGPPVLASMALDRWMPTRFATLSDRFVAQNGVIILGGAALAVLLLTHGSIELLLVFYSINVFITFSLSQLGMVRHWWRVRGTEPKWVRRLAVNAAGLTLTTFILAALIALKFHEGGWVTLVMTAVLVGAAFAIHRHYRGVAARLSRLNLILDLAQLPPTAGAQEFAPGPNRTAVMLVNGFNGLGMHTLLGAMRMAGGKFRQFVFLQIGVLDAGNFKGVDEIENLRRHVHAECERYAEFVRRRGGVAEIVTSLGSDILAEFERQLPLLTDRFPDAIFFGGQLVFEEETWLTRLLHNYTAFALQRRLFLHGLPCVVVPIRVDKPVET